MPTALSFFGISRESPQRILGEFLPWITDGIMQMRRTDGVSLKSNSKSKMQKNAEKCRKMQKNAEKCRKIHNLLL